MIFLVFDESGLTDAPGLCGAFSTRLVAEAWVRREHIRELAGGIHPRNYRIRAVEINAA